MFGNIDTAGMEESGDRIGGFQIHDTALYESTVKLAYVTVSSGGATGLVVHFELPEGKSYRETFWFLTKKGLPYSQKDGDPKAPKKALMGYTVANDIALFTTGKGILDGTQRWEEKEVKIYNPETKTEEPKGAQVLMDAIGEKVILGLFRKTVDKTANDGNGNYLPTGETREENSVDKVFSADNRATTTEVINSKPAGKFYEEWDKAHTGTLKNFAKGKPGNAGAPGRPAPVAGGAAQRSSSSDMFAKK